MHSHVWGMTSWGAQSGAKIFYILMSAYVWRLQNWELQSRNLQFRATSFDFCHAFICSKYNSTQQFNVIVFAAKNMYQI